MFAVSNHAKSSSVLMIFNHQDIPSIVGISCQGVPYLSREISGYIVVYQYQCYYDVRSFKAMQGLALSVLMVSLLETSLFTRVVYPQYMEQLIVWYFSSFSVNLLFYGELKLSKQLCSIYLKLLTLYYGYNYSKAA